MGNQRSREERRQKGGGGVEEAGDFSGQVGAAHWTSPPCCLVGSCAPPPQQFAAPGTGLEPAAQQSSCAWGSCRLSLPKGVRDLGGRGN